VRRSGESLATIGKVLGATAETVRSRLADIGVTMRQPNGRMPGEVLTSFVSTCRLVSTD
jgi:hypothetical protein